MNERSVALGVVAAGLVLAASIDADPAMAQSADQNQSGSESSWEHPRTPWGDPDLRGMWPIGHLIGTPFQRPEEMGTREFLTDEEFAERAERIQERNTRYEEEQESNRIGMGHWAEETDLTRITSLLVYPEDGRFPELTEYGRKKSEAMGSSWSRDVYDWVDDFDTWDRCITRGMPPSMFPFNYNNGIRIMQSPGYVILNLEMIHEARIIPVDGRPPLDNDIKQWMGESRGHWEGNTLVVETTNFNGKTGMTNVGIPGSPRHDTPTTTDMKITERFERVGPDTINYSITVEDPAVLESSWTARYPMRRDPDYEFFEYACHEDNTAVRNFIETSRYERRQAAQEQGQQQGQQQQGSQ